MSRVRNIALLAALLSVVAYRSGSTLKNVVLFKTPLPVGYVANGDYAAGACKYLGPGEGSATEDPFGAMSYCEDTAFWEIHQSAHDSHPKRLVYATCDPNRKSWNTVMGPLRDPNPMGSLWVYDPAADPSVTPKPTKVTLQHYPTGHDFHPLGFEIWPSHAGEASNLYVINHARARTTIEHFILHPSDPTVANYIRTLTSPFFVSPNSIALTSPTSFYITNDHLITRRWPVLGHILPFLETVLSLPISFVSHITLTDPHDPRDPRDQVHLSHTISVPFISFPNGIAISSSGRRVAIASSALSKIFFYTRDPSTNALTFLPSHTVTLPFNPDNVRFTHDHQSTTDHDDYDTDELIVAGHPHLPSLLNLAKNTTNSTSGSWVVSILPTPRHLFNTKPHRTLKNEKFDFDAPTSLSLYISQDPTYTLQTLFQSNGEEGGFASSSTGIVDPETKTLFVSGLYDPHGVLVCRPDPPTLVWPVGAYAVMSLWV